MPKSHVVKIYPRTQSNGDKAAVVLRCPSDKSLTHRAVMFSAMAKGASRVHAPLLGEDCLATIQAFRLLGVSIDIIKSENPGDMGFLRIESPGWDSWKSPAQTLDFANSGTTTRLLIGVFAATPDLQVSCTGDASLQKRPMARVVEPLRAMGAIIAGNDNGNFLPISISGQKLKAKSHVVNKASAQIKSALILAGLNCEGTTSVRLPKGSRNHTELLLRHFSAKVRFREDGPDEIVEVEGPFRPKPLTMKIPADPSSVAFFAVLAALHKGLSIKLTEVLNNDTRTGFLRVLEQAGAQIKSTEYGDDEYCEATFKLQITGTDSLKAFEVQESVVPTLVDEVPVLAVLAAFSDGTCYFHGLHELRVKESDRLTETITLLRAAGVECEAFGDHGLKVVGKSGRSVRAFSYDPKTDHRLAMAAAVLASRADGPCNIADPDCVKVSFPGFYEFLNACGMETD